MTTYPVESRYGVLRYIVRDDIGFYVVASSSQYMRFGYDADHTNVLNFLDFDGGPFIGVGTILSDLHPQIPNSPQVTAITLEAWGGVDSTSELDLEPEDNVHRYRLETKDYAIFWRVDDGEAYVRKLDDGLYYHESSVKDFPESLHQGYTFEHLSSLTAFTLTKPKIAYHKEPDSYHDLLLDFFKVHDKENK